MLRGCDFCREDCGMIKVGDNWACQACYEKLGESGK